MLGPCRMHAKWSIMHVTCFGDFGSDPGLLFTEHSDAWHCGLHVQRKGSAFFKMSWLSISKLSQRALHDKININTCQAAWNAGKFCTLPLGQGPTQ